MQKDSPLWGFLAVAAVAGAAIWYFRKRDSYVSVEEVNNTNPQTLPLFLPSTYTPGYMPLDISAPGGVERILQQQLATLQAR